MQQNRFRFIHFGLFICAFFLSASAAYLYISAPELIETRTLSRQQRSLPQNFFSQTESAYQYTDGTPFALFSTPPKIRLPDLRPHLLFTGKNGRPDCDPETQKMHFTFQGSKDSFSCSPGEKVYLRYDKKQTGCKYLLEANQQDSLLWFTAQPQNNEVEVQVCMVDQDGEKISGEGREHFTLALREGIKAVNGWELGKWRVDGTLLARQKARWVGQDKFFERYGGEEFEPLAQKQRIDLGEGAEAYSLYAAPGECFVWDEERWKQAQPGIETRDKPLLTVKKVEERVLMMDLWDIEGKSKIALNLIRMPESFAATPITQEFRFVGARTKTKVLFEIDQERMILKPHDWLVLTSEGWKKLSTPDEIDAYVERKIVGPLFVFEGISRKDDKQVMIGTLVAPNRTELQDVEIALHSPSQENIKPTRPVEALNGDNPIATQH